MNADKERIIVEYKGWYGKRTDIVSSDWFQTRKEAENAEYIYNWNKEALEWEKIN